MTREELEKIVEENQSFYVLNANGNLLRAKECAFFGGLTEESALAYYETIKDSLGEDINIQVTELELDDISSFSLLYMGNSYPNFFIAEYGPLPTELLYTIRQDIIEETRDLFIGLPSGKLLYPMNKDGNGIEQVIGNKHIVQSFYTTEENLKKFEPAEDYTIASISLVSILAQAKGFDPLLFTINDKLISGYEYFEALWAYFKEIQMTGEEIKELIKSNKFYYWEVTDKHIPSYQFNLPIIFTSRELAEENAKLRKAPAKVLPINDMAKFIGIHQSASHLTIQTGKDEFKYCYISDLDIVLSDGDISRCRRNICKYVRKITNTPNVYITTVEEDEEGAGRPRPMLIGDNKHILPLFTNLEEAEKFVIKNNIDSTIGLVDNTSEKNLLKMMVFNYMAGLDGVKIFDKAPTNQESFLEALYVESADWLEFLGVFNADIIGSVEAVAKTTYKTVFRK